MLHKSSADNVQAPKVCDPHEGYNFFYCKNCKAALCENCKQGHVEAGHNISDAASYAFKFKERIAKFKSDHVNEINLGEVKLKKYQLEVQNTIERALLGFDLRIANYLKIIRDKMGRRKDKLYGEFIDILKKLGEEVKCNEYNEELGKIGSIIENIDQSKISQLKKKDLHKKYTDKKEQMNNLFRQGRKTLEKSKSFVRDCKEMEETFKMYEQATLNNLTKIYEKEILKIKECEIRLNDRLQELQRETDKYSQVLQESQNILREKQSLEKEVQALEDHRRDLIPDIDSLKARLLAIKRNIEELEEENKSKQIQSNTLDSLIAQKKMKMKSVDTLDGEERKKLGIVVEMDYNQVKLAFDSHMLYIFDQKLITLFVYNFTLKFIFKFNVRDFKIASNCSCVQVGDDFYVSGGFDTYNVQFSKSTQKISFKSEQDLSTEKKAEMSMGKSQHKLVMLNLSYIYSLGGKSKDKKFLNMCERYDMNNNKWENGPALSEAKLNVGATSMNGCAIYAFGGFKGVYCATIEVLDLNTDSKDKNKWKAIKLGNANGWAARNEVGCFQCSDREILVFGGIDITGGCNDEIFKFDVKDKTIAKTAWRLSKKEWFTMATPVRIKDDVYVAGFFGNEIHMYSPNDSDPNASVWSMATTKDWKCNV
eukprot:TRINITY_DN1232_c0_g3_i2.p1 TRINITY_DN1232_c0_g3~~TRINITY_DN1232_c0_g3_i2.p1  ORF type:complete len:651 (+),score=206.56 TRINITY_DN1232_c0_g3_i2:201-2153(+)